MSLRSVFSRLGIGPRIYAGFLCVVAAVVLVGALAYSAAEQARRNFAELEQVRARATAILELDRAVVELQRNVQNYTHTGHASVARRVERDIADLFTRLDRVGGLLRGPDERELFGRMEQHFSTYQETFEIVVAERQLRQELVGDTLVKTQAKFRDAAEALRGQGGDSASIAALEAAMLTAEFNLYRYLTDPQYSLLVDAKQALNAGRRAFEQGASPQRDDVVQARARLLDTAQRFDREFTRVVQATRSYLYFIGVVMAGEAHEFSYVSTKLRDIVLREVAPITNRIAGATDAGKTTAAWASVIAVALALLISWLIARSISGPIKHITTTFNQLAAGEDSARIPGIDRRDEIGVLAKAANVFREKNEETRRLLEQARRLSEELDQHKQELERSNQELEQFVYTVSHDLKSPVVTSLGFIGMMRKLAARGKQDEAIRKLDTIEKANKRMGQLIENLLDLSRVGRVDMDFRQLDMNQLIGDLVEGLSGKQRPGVSIEIAESLPAVWGNESRVLQVFDNLLGNALKYGVREDGTGTVVIGGAARDDEIRYYVRDDGPGIPEKFHERVFGLFQRLDASSPGTGIGLTIVMKVMTFHGGRVWIESTGEGDGACFWLAFPLRDNDKEHEHER